MAEQFPKPPAKATPLGIFLVVGFVVFIVWSLIAAINDPTPHPPEPREAWEAYTRN
jgi:hypothetical protein